MSCYLRNLVKILDEAGIEVTRDNRDKIDAFIRSMVGAQGESCPKAWRMIREAIKQDKEGFVARMREAATIHEW